MLARDIWLSKNILKILINNINRSMRFFHAIVIGIKRRPLAFFSNFLLAYSVIWTTIESTSYFISEIKLQGIFYYAGMMIASLLVAFIRAHQRHSVNFKVPQSNTKITISFGDIFDREGFIAIPVNEYFDSEIGLPVSPKSLHGIVINRFFGGHSASFDQLVLSELANQPSEQVERKGGKTKKFAIGTTASIKTTSRQFLLFALCTTDATTFKASASLTDLTRALEGLCSKARFALGGERLVIPVAGTGLAGIGMPHNQILQLILLVLVNETKKSQITFEIEVVIQPIHFDDVDLSSIEGNFKRF